MVGEFLSGTTLQDILNGPGLADATTIESRVVLPEAALQNVPKETSEPEAEAKTDLRVQN